MIRDLREKLSDQDIGLTVVGTTGSVRDTLRAAGLNDLLGTAGPHATVEDAVQGIERRV